MKYRSHLQWLICLFLVPILVLGCKSTDNELHGSIVGSWRVVVEEVSGQLKSVPPPTENLNYNNISIEIPDIRNGSISGNTFHNSIWVDIQLLDDQMISFKNYGGTRVAEDSWGMAFYDNLLKSVRYVLDINDLQFIDAENRVILEFVRID